MTLSTDSGRVQYTGNGNVDTYAYNFRIFQEADLRVTVRDTSDPPVETTLALTTDYTVSGEGTLNGGNVALVNSSQVWLDVDGDLKTGYELSIRRVVDIVQETDIRNQGPFFPEIHEDEFDYLTMIDQQQQDAIDRSLHMSETFPDVDTELPAPDSGKFLRWNTTEDGLENAAVANTAEYRAGVAAIINGASSKSITFSTAVTDSYAVQAVLINVTDASPQYQPVTITATSTAGFTASWNAPVDTANYSLSWMVIEVA